MRTLIATLFASVLLLTPACSRREAHDFGRTASRESDTAAQKAGRASYEASREAGKFAKKAGQEIREKAREFHEGWVDAKHEHKK
jgi:NAD+--asparagine ADP-ribosyltransferase